MKGVDEFDVRGTKHGKIVDFEVSGYRGSGEIIGTEDDYHELGEDQIIVAVHDDKICGKLGDQLLVPESNIRVKPEMDQDEKLPDDSGVMSEELLGQRREELNEVKRETMTAVEQI